MQALFARWVASSWRVACALPRAVGAGYASLPPGASETNLGGPASYAPAAWNIATNDQFGLSRILTPASPRAAPGLHNMSWAVLSRPFNVRAGRAGGGDGAVVVRHDGATKDRAESKMSLAQRAARGGLPRQWRRRGGGRGAGEKPAHRALVVRYGVGTKFDVSVEADRRRAEAWAQSSAPCQTEGAHSD